MALEFQKVRWKNFLSSGNNFIEIDLNKSTRTLIIGKNGSGKSTLLDAITFGLFGKPFRKISKPTLVNSINDGSCLVEIDFNIGTKQYHIERGIKPNIFTITINGITLDQASSVRDSQEYFEEQILHLNYKSFTQAVILGSATFLPFMQLTAAHRREVIEDLLDIRIFSGMNSILKDRISEVKSNISDNSHGIELAEEKIEIHNNHLKKLQTNHQSKIEKNREDIKESNDSIRGHKSEITNLFNQIQNLDSAITDQTKLQKSKKSMEGLLFKIQTNESKITKEIDFYTDHDDCPTCEQEIDASFKVKTIKTKSLKLNELEKALIELEGKVKVASERLTEISAVKDQINDLQVSINTENNSISALTQYIKKIQTENETLQETKGDLNKEKETIKTLLSETKELEKSQEALSNTKSLYQTAGDLLKDSGIKTLIIKQYIPIINKLINQHLADMDFFVHFTLDENFQETIKSRHRDQFSYYNFSEGEKKRIDLALLFTWRSVARLKNSINTNLLILDEVFDSSLDMDGTEEFMKILYSLGVGQNVFVISHKTDMLHDKFDVSIKFEKVRGFSQVAV
jgi:DNA repair exonuclease SbcCD ATPase subunit